MKKMIACYEDETELHTFTAELIISIFLMQW